MEQQRYATLGESHEWEPSVHRLIDETMAEIEQLSFRRLWDQYSLINTVNALLQNTIWRVGGHRTPLNPVPRQPRSRLRGQVPDYLQDDTLRIFNCLVEKLRTSADENPSRFCQLGNSVSLGLTAAAGVIVDKIKGHATLMTLGGLVVTGITAAGVWAFLHQREKKQKSSVKVKEPSKSPEDAAPKP